MKRRASAIRFLLIGILLIITLFPLYWMVINSFKRTGEFFTDPPQFIPPRVDLKAYQDSLQTTGGKGLQDSLIIATSTMILSVGLGCMGAYAVARYRWGGKNFILLLLVIQMLPPVSIALPLFILFDKLKLLDTYYGLITADTVFNLPYAIWLLQGFFQEIPVEIEEAALVDGSSRWQVFTRIVLPLSLPGLVAVSFFTFIFAWNEFILAFIFSRSRVTPLTVVIPAMVGADTILWERVYATSLIAIVPVIILALLLQRYLVRGLTFGAVKG
ncbi:MAG: carbohydrate ABC transporter permease [Ardenticatenia bacterium]|nr:MAG: carbohydrate ABC transporter permease [Ardenticatenia bacterium]